MVLHGQETVWSKVAAAADHVNVKSCNYYLISGSLWHKPLWIKTKALMGRKDCVNNEFLLPACATSSLLPHRTGPLPTHPPTQRAPVNSLGSVIHPVMSTLPPNTSRIGFSIFLCIHDTKTLMRPPSPLDYSSLTWSPCITPVLERSEKERRVRGFCLLCDHHFT